MCVTPSERFVVLTKGPIVAFLQNFDLSRIKSLRTIEVLASTIIHEEPRELTRTFSTITSPVFSTVIVVYRDYDIHGVRSAWVNRTYIRNVGHHLFTPFLDLFLRKGGKKGKVSTYRSYVPDLYK